MAVEPIRGPDMAEEPPKLLRIQGETERDVGGPVAQCRVRVLVRGREVGAEYECDLDRLRRVLKHTPTPIHHQVAQAGRAYAVSYAH